MLPEVVVEGSAVAVYESLWVTEQEAVPPSEVDLKPPVWLGVRTIRVGHRVQGLESK